MVSLEPDLRLSRYWADLGLRDLALAEPRLPPHPAWGRIRAWLLSYAGHHDDAELLLMSLIEEQGAQVPADLHLQRGLARARAGRIQEAAEDLRAASAPGDYHTAATLALARLRRQAGRPKDALALLEPLLATLRPNSGGWSRVAFEIMRCTGEASPWR